MSSSYHNNDCYEQQQRTTAQEEEHNRYSLVVRFGKDMLQDGFTALPNLLLDLYAELGITHCELVFLLHLIQYKWSRHDPYPALGTIAKKMGLSLRAVQNHVQSLAQKSFRCPHTEEGQEYTCQKYLVVTPRYTVCSGQTSNSYNLSGLFGAVVALARKKGLIPNQEENCTPPVKNPARGDAENCTQRRRTAPKEEESKTAPKEEESKKNRRRIIEEHPS